MRAFGSERMRAIGSERMRANWKVNVITTGDG